MRVNFAHVKVQGFDVAVFDAKPMSRTDDARRQLLVDLTLRARRAGLKIDKSALAYVDDGRVRYFGNVDLVGWLQGVGVPAWTNWIEV
jgi:hypothetical protein